MFEPKTVRNSFYLSQEFVPLYNCCILKHVLARTTLESTRHKICGTASRGIAMRAPKSIKCYTLICFTCLVLVSTPYQVSPIFPIIPCVFIPAFSECLLPVRIVLSGLTSLFPISPVHVSSFPGSDLSACPDPEPGCSSVTDLLCLGLRTSTCPLPAPLL